MAERLLIVDDDSGSNRLLELYLSKSYDVSLASTAADAEKLIAIQPLDFMLVDIHLPDKPGWDLLPLARTLHPDIRIVVVTGSADEERARAKALQLGASQLAVKPVTPLQIRAILEALRKNRPPRS